MRQKSAHRERIVTSAPDGKLGRFLIVGHEVVGATVVTTFTTSKVNQGIGRRR